MSTRTYYTVSKEIRSLGVLYFAQIVEIWGRNGLKDQWVSEKQHATKFAHYEMALRAAKTYEASVGVYEE